MFGKALEGYKERLNNIERRQAKFDELFKLYFTNVSDFYSEVLTRDVDQTESLKDLKMFEHNQFTLKFVHREYVFILATLVGEHRTFYGQISCHKRTKDEFGRPVLLKIGMVDVNSHGEVQNHLRPSGDPYYLSEVLHCVELIVGWIEKDCYGITPDWGEMSD